VKIHYHHNNNIFLKSLEDSTGLVGLKTSITTFIYYGQLTQKVIIRIIPLLTSVSWRELRRQSLPIQWVGHALEFTSITKMGGQG
jgi:hypothetical protein